jgi:hypothetical protein
MYARAQAHLQPAHNLIHQKLHMIISEFLYFDNIRQVGAHEGAHNVHVVQVCGVRIRREHVAQIDHVLVLHVSQQSQFAVCALSVNGRLKGSIELLDGHLLASARVFGGTVSVCMCVYTHVITHHTAPYAPLPTGVKFV